MATASQPIDQPTLPTAGDADSLAGVRPATGKEALEADTEPTNEELLGLDEAVEAEDKAKLLPGDNEDKNSQNTPRNSCELGSNDLSQPVEPTAAEVLAAFQLLHEAAYAKADELGDDYRTLMRRFDEELLPLVDRAQAYLSERGSMHVPGIGLPQWSDWRDAFLKRLKVKMSPATLKRKLYDFRNFGDEDAPEMADDNPEADEQDDDSNDSPTVTVYENPKELLEKRLKEIHTVLSRGTGTVDANAEREYAKRIDRALELLEEIGLAIHEGLFDKLPEDCGGCQHLHRGIVTLAKTNPYWTDERLADETKTSLITIRQARTRYSEWGEAE
jgi:hypothetical protein